MAHHKRKKPKYQRAGCLLCKPHKANGSKPENFEKLDAYDKKEKIEEAVEQHEKSLQDVWSDDGDLVFTKKF